MTAFAAFTNERRRVARRNERRGDMQTTVPYSPHSGHAKSDDPAIWGTRPEAAVRAAEIIDGQGRGIGIELGYLGGDIYPVEIDFGRGMQLWIRGGRR